MFDEIAPGTDRGLLTRTSSGLDMVQWRSGSSPHVHAAERKLLELSLIEANPIRIGGQWQNRPNRHGQYYWAPTGRHVWHESALEAACLMGLEFAGDVEQITAQPFRILFRTGAAPVRHDPDFFALHRSGDQVVYDVKPAARMSSDVRAQFDETARVCDLVGWRHVVLHELHPTLAVNWKHGVRTSACVTDAVERHSVTRTVPAGTTCVGTCSPDRPTQGRPELCTWCLHA